MPADWEESMRLQDKVLLTTAATWDMTCPDPFARPGETCSAVVHATAFRTVPSICSTYRIPFPDGYSGRTQQALAVGHPGAEQRS